jgi:hypothetical protein
MSLEVRDELSALNEALNRLNSLHKQIAGLQELIGGDQAEDGKTNVSYKPVLEQAKSLDKKLVAIQSPLYNTEVQPFGQDDVHYLQRFHEQLQDVLRGIMGAYGEAPNELLVEEAAGLRKQLEQHLQEVNAFLYTDVSGFNKVASEHGSSTLFAGSPIQIKAGDGASSRAGEEDEDNDNDNDQL